jgi:hypothetical protein
VYQFYKNHVTINHSDYEEPTGYSGNDSYITESWGEAWKEIKRLEQIGYTVEQEARISPKSFYQWD